jgi:hypothetical protein
MVPVFIRSTGILINREVFHFISALEVGNKKRNKNATSSAEMKGVASPTKLLDKAIWNPRPMAK